MPGPLAGLHPLKGFRERAGQAVGEDDCVSCKDEKPARRLAIARTAQESVDPGIRAEIHVALEVAVDDPRGQGNRMARNRDHLDPFSVQQGRRDAARHEIDDGTSVEHGNSLRHGLMSPIPPGRSPDPGPGRPQVPIGSSCHHLRSHSVTT